jgi:hypothetical protein
MISEKTELHTFTKKYITWVPDWIRLRNLYERKVDTEGYVVDTGFATFGLKMTKLW